VRNAVAVVRSSITAVAVQLIAPTAMRTVQDQDTMTIDTANSYYWVQLGASPVVMMVVVGWSSTGLVPTFQCGGIVGLLLLQGQVGGVSPMNPTPSPDLARSSCLALICKG
jgi:hypothetical protein